MRRIEPDRKFYPSVLLFLSTKNRNKTVGDVCGLLRIGRYMLLLLTFVSQRDRRDFLLRLDIHRKRK